VNPNWTEEKLEFDLSGAAQPVERPDAAAQPLKAVDFIAKYPHELLLIEVKDPEGAPLPHQAGAINAVISKLQNDGLLKEHLLPKLYGTFVYLIGEGREPHGRVRYVTLMGLSSPTAAERSMLTDKIQRVIDRIGPKIRHSRLWPIAEVHNIASWNAKYPQMSITRHP
jgi:hypothetical protein